MSTDALAKVFPELYKQNTETIVHLSADKTWDEMTEEEKAEVRRLKKLDAEVKAHEEAHKRAAGELARGGVHFKYKIGPDGKRYAVGGEVKIDLSEDPRGPKETKLKAEKIKRAALAPARPSPKDRQVAAAAVRMEMKADQELARKKKEESNQNAQIYDSHGKIVKPNYNSSSINFTL